ncbi:restriction endonuclease subunit S [Sansalvadorimonas verongulae]|uniref:restriction endonuclease subunit S n=1 Tax=Sansalvadorimonas verongulae TaxID=2172824 RepID=UPI0038B5D5DF
MKLSEICRPKQWKTIASSKLIDSGFPVYGANGQIGYYSEYTHENPTLMITCRGATCGNVHISVPKSYINGNAMALDNLDQERVYIKYLY